VLPLTKFFLFLILVFKYYFRKVLCCLMLVVCAVGFFAFLPMI